MSRRPRPVLAPGAAAGRPLLAALALITAVVATGLVVPRAGASEPTADAEPGPGVTATVDHAVVEIEPGRGPTPSPILGESHSWLPGASTVRAERTTVDAEGGTTTQEALQVDLGSRSDVARLELVAPPGEELREGTYENVRSFAPRDAGTARMRLVVEGRACRAETLGRVEVRELSADLSRVWLVFDLHCQGRESRTFGEVRIGAPRPAGPVAAVSQVAWPDQHPGKDGFAVPVVLDATSPVEAVVEGDPAFVVLGSTCDRYDGGPCRVLVGFRPRRVGAAEGRLVLRDARGTTTVALSGTGRPGTTAWELRTPTGTRVLDPRTSDVVVDGDASEVVFYLDDGSADGVVFGTLTAPGDGIQPGRTYTEVDPFRTFGTTEPTLVVSAPGDPDPAAPATVHVDEATYGPRGDLRSLSFTYLRSAPDTGQVRVSGALSWQAERAAVPATPPHPGPESVPAPFGLDVATQVGSLDVTWDPVGLQHVVDALVRVRTGRPGGPERVLHAGRSTRVPVTGLPVGVDVEISVQLVDRWGNRGPITDVRATGTRMTLDRSRAGRRTHVVSGRLVSSTGAAEPRRPISLLVRRPGGPTVTTTTWTDDAGRFRLDRPAFAGYRVTAVFEGTDQLERPTAMGVAATVSVPRR